MSLFNTPDDWPQLPLQADEQVLWRGRPRADLHFGVETFATGAFALVLGLMGAGAGLVLGPALGVGWWWVMAAALVPGGALVVGVAMLDRARRARLRYALTTRRAFVYGPLKGTRIAQDWAGWVLDDPARLTLRGASPATIRFGKRPNLQSNMSPRYRTPFDVAFERIDDGARVFEMMQAVAKGTPPLERRE